MEKFHSWVFATLISACVFCSCSSDRENTLKVYNWSNYIGAGVIDDFEQWYQQQTGKEIQVVYQTFDINETMLSKIELGHEDFDVVCPSDYIIERMLNSGMLLPLDFTDIPDSLNYIKNNRSPYVRDMFRLINPEIDANDYSVAFMWGTTGILYNTKYVSEEEASTMEILRNKKFAGKIFMKDAPRDVYGPILIHLKQRELADSVTTLDQLMKESTDGNIALVESFMNDVKPLVAGWEADFGKEQMTMERGYVSLNWSGDAVWAIDEAKAVGVDLKYVVPSEGSNVWFDGWVIPKYAKNVSAATMFINFMCRPDIAIRNMEETGYVSANGDISVLMSQADEDEPLVDASYFFGPEASAVHVNPVLYPDKATIANCALMHDWGKETDKLIGMWSRIKGENSNFTTMLVIILAGTFAIGYLIYRSLGGKKRKKSGKKHA